jgi:hypothetical protein
MSTLYLNLEGLHIESYTVHIVFYPILHVCILFVKYDSNYVYAAHTIRSNVIFSTECYDLRNQMLTIEPRSIFKIQVARSLLLHSFANSLKALWVIQLLRYGL